MKWSFESSDSSNVGQFITAALDCKMVAKFLLHRLLWDRQLFEIYSFYLSKK